MPSAQLSGTAVALATAGGLLVYAGLRGVGLSDSLREIASGKPQPIRATGATWSTSTGSAGVGTRTVGTVTGVRLVEAARRHQTERYSQARRWQSGYSDCSSFVGKSFKDIGVTIPVIFTTSGLATWRALRRIDRSEVAAGDIVLAPGRHVILATSNTDGIGQQNRRRNVQSGPIGSLINGPLIYLRYVGLG